MDFPRKIRDRCFKAVLLLSLFTKGKECTYNCLQNAMQNSQNSKAVTIYIPVINHSIPPKSVVSCAIRGERWCFEPEVDFPDALVIGVTNAQDENQCCQQCRSVVNDILYLRRIALALTVRAVEKK